MRRWIPWLLIGCIGVNAVAALPEAWFGRASAMIDLPPGGTRIAVGWDGGGPAVTVNRPVAPRIAGVASVSSVTPFALRAVFVLIADLVPFVAAAAVGTDGIGMVSTLFFGPVRIDAGRCWGSVPNRWGTVQLSARPGLSLLFGAIEHDGEVEPFAGVRLFPGGHGLWEIDLSIGREAVRWAIAGVAW